ncbi:MAG: sigma-70 family RNA polymerase sigma factor [Clostridiales bacterium]|nr:sigma-70 family RNA polymerase sigma factor [Clostridiales bacterium]
MYDTGGEKLNNLILAVADGHADCLDGILKLAGGQMMAVALSMVGRDYAEDVLHDSFIKIARFAKSYRPGTSPYGWLMKIVRNTALDFLKAKKTRAEVSSEVLFSLSSLDYSPERKESAIDLERAIAKLEPDEKKIIYFVYYLDMTVREIAGEMNMSKSAVQRLKEKAEEKLKNLLK